MADREHEEHHCPFINRADARCSEHFHLDDLNHAFEYCFGRFKRCAVYGERLGEWRLRKRLGIGDTSNEGPEYGREVSYGQNSSGGEQAAGRSGVYVQVTVPPRYAKRLAPSAELPRLPRLGTWAG